MDKRPTPARPVPSRLQLAWLREIGLDGRLLKTWVRDTYFQAENRRLTVATQSSSQPTVPDKGSSQSALPDKGSGQPGLLDEADSLPQNTVIAGQVVSHRSRIATDWQALEKQVITCQACPLHAERHRAIVGTGTRKKPQLVLIGDVPGLLDDRYGQPFQGKAGELLKAMLAAIGLGQEAAVFYTTLIRCRPPTSRIPTSAEIAACLPYLQRQLSLLQPGKVLLFGKMTAQALLATDRDLDELRGTVHQLELESGQSVQAVVTYHPASLLSRPQHKAAAWQDLNLLSALV